MSHWRVTHHKECARKVDTLGSRDSEINDERTLNALEKRNLLRNMAIELFNAGVSNFTNVMNKLG